MVRVSPMTTPTPASEPAVSEARRRVVRGEDPITRRAAAATPRSRLCVEATSNRTATSTTDQGHNVGSASPPIGRNCSRFHASDRVHDPESTQSPAADTMAATSSACSASSPPAEPTSTGWTSVSPTGSATDDANTAACAAPGTSPTRTGTPATAWDSTPATSKGVTAKPASSRATVAGGRPIPSAESRTSTVGTKPSGHTGQGPVQRPRDAGVVSRPAAASSAARPSGSPVGWPPPAGAPGAGSPDPLSPSPLTVQPDVPDHADDERSAGRYTTAVSTTWPVGPSVGTVGESLDGTAVGVVPGSPGIVVGDGDGTPDQTVVDTAVGSTK